MKPLLVHLDKHFKHKIRFVCIYAMGWNGGGMGRDCIGFDGEGWDLMGCEG